MNKQFHIGNITKVRWHYTNFKYGYMAWGHSMNSFDTNFWITKQHPHLETATISKADQTMNPDKCYAYICIDESNNLIIRNLFDSKHEKGFDQKNTYFQDNLFYDLFLNDPLNLLDAYLLDAYLKIDGHTREDNDIIYYCVEYEPCDNLAIDLELLLYCAKLERYKSDNEDKLRIIDIQNDLKKNKKSCFSYFW